MRARYAKIRAGGQFSLPVRQRPRAEGSRSSLSRFAAAAVSAATGAETAGEVAALPLEVIKEALSGDGVDAATALAVFRAVRGESRAAVVEKAAPKSLMAAKSLDAATSSRAVLEKWLAILSDELATRLEADGRPPRTLALHYRCRGMAGGAEVSSCTVRT